MGGENPDVVALVDNPATTALNQMVRMLISNYHYRATLGKTALAKGDQFFSHGRVIETFYQALLHGKPGLRQAAS